MPTLRNKKTGQIIVIPDGGGIAPNPIKVRGAQADVDNTEVDTRRKVVQTQGDALGNQQAARELRQTPISKEDMDVINGLRESLGNIDEALQYTRDAAPIIDRFKPGPNRAEIVGSAIPERGSGITGTIGSTLRRTIGGVSQKDIADYQALQRYANFQVAQKQLEQKGPQTESDAMRLMMTGISPDKLPKVNAKIVADAVFRGEIAKQKPDFYLKWANRNGSLGSLENGKSVDQAWNELVKQRTQKFNAKPTIRGLREGVPKGKPKMDSEVEGYLRQYGNRK